MVIYTERDWKKREKQREQNNNPNVQTERMML